MTSALPPSPLRPRVGVRDVVPILAAGAAAALLILAADQVARVVTGGAGLGLSARSIANAAALGVALSFALAGMQGRADAMTRGDVYRGWLSLVMIGLAGALVAGQVKSPIGIARVTIICAGSAGISALLYVLRKRQ